MTTKMFISVIIPTYNKTGLLLKTLDYLDRQTLSKDFYEVIIIDDGSTDNTEQYIKGFIEQVPYVKYIKKTHGGPGDSRNLGIKHAKGDIIAFTDDDCIITRNWLKNIYERFSGNKEITGIEGETLTFYTELNPLMHAVINKHNPGFRVFPTCNVAYKKDILEKTGGFYHKFKYPHNEDIDLAWNILKHREIIFDRSIIVIHPIYYRNIFKKLAWTFYFKDEFLLYNRHKKLYKKFRVKNPWLLIYYHFYIKYNLFLVGKYIKHKKGRILSLLSLEIIVFLILQGIFLFFLIFYFICIQRDK